MIRVFQTLTIDNDGFENSFNACVASILERPLRDVAGILQSSDKNTPERWRVWLAENGLKRAFFEEGVPPKGYGIATVYTERTYPIGHSFEGKPLSHSCVSFNGTIVHDPYPLGSEIKEIKYYLKLAALTPAETICHKEKAIHGTCAHGYFISCVECGK
jgi:hypothetical protein